MAVMKDGGGQEWEITGQSVRRRMEDDQVAATWRIVEGGGDASGGTGRSRREGGISGLLGSMGDRGFPEEEKSWSSGDE